MCKFLEWGIPHLGILGVSGALGDLQLERFTDLSSSMVSSARILAHRRPSAPLNCRHSASTKQAIFKLAGFRRLSAAS